MSHKTCVDVECKTHVESIKDVIMNNLAKDGVYIQSFQESGRHARDAMYIFGKPLLLNFRQEPCQLRVLEQPATRSGTRREDRGAHAPCNPPRVTKCIRLRGLLRGKE